MLMLSSIAVASLSYYTSISISLPILTNTYIFEAMPTALEVRIAEPLYNEW